MDRFARRMRRQSFQWLVIALVPAALSFAVSQAQGSPIKHHAQVASVTDSNLQTWTAYLKGGPTLWSEKPYPHVSASVIAAFHHGLNKPEPLSSVWVQFLLFRYKLHPTRFAFYHPNISPELKKLEQQINPPPPPPPPPVPEPGSLSISVVLLGAGLWWRRRSQRKSAELVS